MLSFCIFYGKLYVYIFINYISSKFYIFKVLPGLSLYYSGNFNLNLQVYTSPLLLFNYLRHGSREKCIINSHANNINSLYHYNCMDDNRLLKLDNDNK